MAQADSHATSCSSHDTSSDSWTPSNQTMSTQGLNSNGISMGAPTNYNLSEPARLRITHGKSDGQVIHKTFLVNPGQEQMLEILIRKAFSIPQSLAVSLVLDGDVICYPINVIDLNEARSADIIEVQTFPQQQAPTMPLASSLKSVSTSSGESNNRSATSSEIARQQQQMGAMNSSLVPTLKPPTNRGTKRSAPKASAVPVYENSPLSFEQDSKEDRRKNNRGLDHRRSYLKEEKVLVMWLKDAGKSADEISLMTSVSKSNIEKWCSDKTREKILVKFSGTPSSVAASTSNNAGETLSAYLNDTGLHFNDKDPAAMQGALLVLLDRLAVLSTESNMTLDRNALFQTAGIPTAKPSFDEAPASKRARPTNEMISTASGGMNHSSSNNNSELLQAASLLHFFGTNSLSATPLLPSLGTQDSDDEEDEDDDKQSQALVAKMLREKRQSLGIQKAVLSDPLLQDPLPLPRQNTHEMTLALPNPDSSILLHRPTHSTILPTDSVPSKQDSQFTMQYTEQVPFSLSGADNYNLMTATETQALRPVLSNTRYLIAKRDMLGMLPPQSEEDQEDCAVLSMLGE